MVERRYVRAGLVARTKRNVAFEKQPLSIGNKKSRFFADKTLDFGVIRVKTGTPVHHFTSLFFLVWFSPKRFASLSSLLFFVA